MVMASEAELDRALEGTDEVVVVTPCICATPCKQWFMCETHLTVAEYAVKTFDTVIDERQLAYIRTQHPGMTLIY